MDVRSEKADHTVTRLAQWLYFEQLDAIRRRTDHLFAALMVLQWLFGIAAALWISPLTWVGETSSTHPHVWIAIFLGGAIASLPCYLAWMHPGKDSTRQVIAVAQMMWSALLIHLTGGRIETHFHVFGSLAFLACYRDWKVLGTATLVVAVDHFVRGFYWPQSVYGVIVAAPWRTFEHGAWVIFEDIFLIISIRQSLTEMQEIALQHAKLSCGNEELHVYTTELETAQRKLQRQAIELERQADDLKEARAKAEQSSRLKGEFLAHMSHEIRTPMTAILGFADILADQVTTPEQSDAARTIQHNGRHLLAILNDILDLSKIEANELQIEKFRCLPHQIVSEVTSLMRVRASAKGLNLSIEYVGLIPEIIQTDPKALRQILVNLVGNAIKFTECGGVRIVVSCLADDDEPQMCFEIVDTGIGMSDEELGRLFRPFAQADASMSRRFGGTGLGLTISKRLAELLGGTIEVESCPGQGSTFRLLIAAGSFEGVRMLDQIDESVNVGERASHRPAIDLKLDGRILLAEDGAHNQRFLTLFLTKAGAEVSVAENGQVAVELAMAASSRGEPFDVILMDMQMPVLDGYAAVRKLRNYDYLGAIIALTAHAMSDDRDKCLAVGCDDYATKPIDRPTLLRLVAEHLHAARV